MNVILKKYFLLLLVCPIFSVAQKFENPVHVEWIKENIAPESPRLLLTPSYEQLLKEKIQSEEATKLSYQLLLKRADDIIGLEPLERKQIGRRLLSISREAVQRMSVLALAYRLEKEQKYLTKLEEELVAVSGFTDWNPSHFLDVAEMSAAVAVALDWCGEWMNPSVKERAENALIEKGLKQSIAASQSNWWINAHHNWNLVCHGGLSMAAIYLFEKEPELASYVLYRAVEKIPLALEPYAPDGIYPEGPSYWFYATHYLTLTISAYESAFDTNFGFAEAPGVLSSAEVSEIIAGPTGQYYNFFDSNERGFHSLGHYGLLAWFANHSSQKFNEKEYIAKLQSERNDSGKYSRFYAFNMINTAILPNDKKQMTTLPKAWTGKGESPIVVLRSGTAKHDFFLAAKGGRAADNHGNMDAGSFIFELDGVRWSIDPGNQGYNQLEQIMGGALWNRAQDSRRWELLTKNNYGHSTLTINGEKHIADARAILLTDDLERKTPSATFDLTPVFGDLLQKAHRTFRQIDQTTLVIMDELHFSPKTETLTWQMMTQAEVQVNEKEILLKQDRKQLKLTVNTSVNYEVEVIPLSPPPLEYDKDILNLKRIEIKMESSNFEGKVGKIAVRLSRE